MKFQAKAIINAPAKDVFRILSDTALYSQLDPHCIRASGIFAEGNVINMYYKNDIIEKFKVISLTKDQKIVLEKSLPFDLFDIIRTFTIIAKDDFTTELRRSDEGRGLLLWIFKNKIADRAQLHEFCLHIKRYIESRP